MKRNGIRTTIKMKTLNLAGIIVLAICGTARAQTPDAALNALVKKGFLTENEAKDAWSDATRTNVAAGSKFEMVPWVKGVKLGGDFRGRYDGAFQDAANSGPGSATQDRSRFRYRLRYGLTANLADRFEVGLRLGSGEIGSAAPSLGGSPFSANTTEGNDASRKFIFVDLAYAKWKPADWLSVEIGKMINAFWFTDMVMDPDYNPEGAQEKLTLPLGEHHKLNFTAGQYVILENFNATTNSASSPNGDVYIFMAQADWMAKWCDHLSSRVGVAGYAFANQRNVSSSLETFLSQNGTSAAGASAPNFNPIIGRAELTYTLDGAPCFRGPFPITAMAEYANNPGAEHLGSSRREAWNVGGMLGDAKSKGNWALIYNYKHIGTAAVWHGLNDDDFGYNAKGGTGVAGHQVIASYHIFEPLVMNVRFMQTEQINRPVHVSSEQTRVFFDLLFTF